jgi:hypothetical protein
MERRETARVPSSLVSDIFRYHEQFRVFICQTCQCVVVDKQIARHLRVAHTSPKGPPFSSSAVLDHFEQHPERVQSMRDIPHPAMPVPPVPGLTIYSHCYQCCTPACGWIGRGLHRIQDHYRQHHHHHGDDSATMGSTACFPSLWKPVSCQRFISRGPGSQLFAIGATGLQQAPVSPVVDEATNNHPLDTVASFGPSSSPQTPARASLSPEPPIKDHPVPTGSVADEPPSRPRAEADTCSLSGQKLQHLRHFLLDWQAQCSVCRTRPSPFQSWQPHQLESCHDRDAPTVRRETRRIQQAMRSSLTTCSQCLMPRGVCARYQEPCGDCGPEEDWPCRFPNLILPAVVSFMFADPGLCDQIILPWMQRDGVKIHDASQVYEWFGREIQWGDITVNQLICVFYLIAPKLDRRA